MLSYHSASVSHTTISSSISTTNNYNYLPLCFSLINGRENRIYLSIFHIPHMGPKTSKKLPLVFRHSLILENKSSVARDHMANERTFLAWTRTSSIFITLAITFIQFVHITGSINSVTIEGKTYDLSQLTARNHWSLTHYGKAVEVLGLVLGLITFIFGAVRFFRVQKLLTQDYFPATRMTILTLLSVNMTMLVLLLVLDIKLRS